MTTFCFTFRSDRLLAPVPPAALASSGRSRGSSPKASPKASPGASPGASPVLHGGRGSSLPDSLPTRSAASWLQTGGGGCCCPRAPTPVSSRSAAGLTRTLEATASTGQSGAGPPRRRGRPQRLGRGRPCLRLSGHAARWWSASSRTPSTASRAARRSAPRGEREPLRRWRSGLGWWASPPPPARTSRSSSRWLGRSQDSWRRCSASRPRSRSHCPHSGSRWPTARRPLREP
mmetsp:Transcript_2889/g.7021  ORF Transcript_2889/g.7021 Transcript_2889/m.7021 type:complete len:232 (+) Transcript_2889:1312-2007(+)